jgi:hypothetical protein
MKIRMSNDPIKHAQAILGEHCRNYVLIASTDADPMVYDLRFNDPYAAQALLKNATRYHDVYVSGGATPMNEDDEWEWEEEDDDDGDGDVLSEFDE